MIHWNPDPEIIKIFGVSLRFYSILFVSGLIFCFYISRWIYKREKIPYDNLERLTLYAFIGIFAGARLGHCLFYEFSYYMSHPLGMFLPISFPPEGGIEITGYQGLASHGGIVGLLIAVYFYSRKTKQTIINTLDLIAVVSGLGFGFIRLGNFMNSEIIGMPTSKPWAVIFERVDNVPRHPAQFYEAISYLAIFTLLMILYTKGRGRLKNGFFFGLGSLLFAATRFLIEFVKEDQSAFEKGMFLNMGQLLSIPFMLIGIGFVIYGLKKPK